MIPATFVLDYLAVKRHAERYPDGCRDSLSSCEACCKRLAFPAGPPAPKRGYYFSSSGHLYRRPA